MQDQGLLILNFFSSFSYNEYEQGDIFEEKNNNSICIYNHLANKVVM